MRVREEYEKKINLNGLLEGKKERERKKKKERERESI